MANSILAALAHANDALPAPFTAMLDDQGFFTQDDWEFQLDQLLSIEDLKKHLTKAPANHPTALWLNSLLLH